MPKEMETWVGLRHGTQMQTGSLDVGGVPGEAALFCWLKEGHVMKSREAGQCSRQHKVCFNFPRSLSGGWSWLFISNPFRGEPCQVLAVVTPS